jgi:hypothetical protein
LKFKHLLFLFPFFLALSLCHADEQPPFEVKDPATTENFRNIYYAVDQLGIGRDANGNITISSNTTISGSVTASTANLASINGTFISGFRNRIINGDFGLCQRWGTGGSTTVIAAANLYGPDRFFAFNRGGAGRIKLEQLTSTGINEFPNAFRITIASADTAITSGDEYFAMTRIEGINIKDFKLGFSDASKFTLSFNVRCSSVGTFGVTFQNGAGDRSYVSSYTVNSVNVWEKKTVTVSGDTSGTWLTTNGNGLSVLWDLGSGSDFNGTAEAWQAGEKNNTSTYSRLISSANVTLDLAGVQLEAGGTATAFEHRPSGVELFLAQRYFEKSNLPGTAPGTVTSANNQFYVASAIAAASTQTGPILFQVDKRVAPTIVTYDPAVLNAIGLSRWYTAAGVGTQRTSVTSEIGTKSFDNSQTNNAVEFHCLLHWTADSEL